MNKAQISEIIALAWDYEAAFDAIERQFGLSAGEVIKLMRLNMKPSSFRIWRKRVSGRKTKHERRSR
ncbi:MAG TPA: TIGR03643 family protein [Rhodobiaceae bacterium]|nr:TIGR03643 family protein [Rhodobiaceae bacterium]